LNKVNVIGAGGHSRSLLAMIVESKKFDVIGVYDDSFLNYPNESIGNTRLVGDLNDVSNSVGDIIVSIGDNKTRSILVNQFRDRVLSDNIASNLALIRPNVKLGKGNQIFPQVFINADAVIGDFCIINSKALIEHESVVGDFCHVAVGALICGRVTIGDHCMIGAGAILKDGINIVDNVVIGAGAVVIKDVNEAGVYVGNPIRKII
jgi:sugar O-acyltransferase (sialic acid O-acetyltransferase NeuD family)